MKLPSNRTLRGLGAAHEKKRLPMTIRSWKRVVKLRNNNLRIPKSSVPIPVTFFLASDLIHLSILSDMTIIAPAIPYAHFCVSLLYLPDKIM
jgi:hypothetical protein